MKYLLLLIILSFSVISKAQYESPLSSISRGKKEHLLKFGENTSVALLSSRTLKWFRLTFDSLQVKTKKGYYKIPDMRADSANRRFAVLPIDVINSLNAQEFGEHILSLYSDSLSENQLIRLNEAFKTEGGIRYKEFLRKVINGEYDEEDFLTSSVIDNIDNYNTFFMMSGVTGYISENLMLVLFLYIEQKSFTYD